MFITAVLTGRDQPHEMGTAATVQQAGGKSAELGQTADSPVRAGGINTCQILGNDAPCTDGHMADFGIADLTFGQANRRSASIKKGFRNGTVQMVNHRCLSQLHSIVAAVFAMAPAIHDTEHNGTFMQTGRVDISVQYNSRSLKASGQSPHHFCRISHDDRDAPR